MQSQAQDEQDSIDVPYSVSGEIPEGLSRKVEDNRDRLVQACIQFLDGGNWKTLTRRIRVDQRQRKSLNVDQLCLDLLEVARKHARSFENKNKLRYRAMLVIDADGTQKRLYAQLDVTFDDEGGIEILDGVADGHQREHLLDLIESLKDEKETLFDKALECLEEARKSNEAHGDSIKKSGEAQRTTAEGLQAVSAAAATALEKAAVLVAAHQADHRDVQLARIEKESEQERWKMIGELLGPAARVFGAQVKATLAKRAAKRTTPELEPSIGGELAAIFGELEESKLPAVKDCLGEDLFTALWDARGDNDKAKTALDLVKTRVSELLATEATWQQGMETIGKLQEILGEGLAERFMKILPD